MPLLLFPFEIMIEVFSQYLKLSSDSIQELLDYPTFFSVDLPEIRAVLSSLDFEVLRATLAEVEPIFIQHLPPFYQWLQSEQGVENVPDNPKHLKEWVISFLKNQERISRLIDLHRPVPLEVLERSVPRLVNLFDKLPTEVSRQEWKKATAFLCFAIVVGCRQPPSQPA